MGASLAYLDKPNKEITYDVGENELVRYTAGSMQGWRINMEDAHIADVSFDKEKDIYLFAVFDGHGGREVAEYSKAHFGKVLSTSHQYKEEAYTDSLRAAFYKIDDLVGSESGKDELATYKRA